MEGEAEPDIEERGPERTCIVTRDKGPPTRMLRFVVGPDGAVVPDIRGRLPGRGAWVTGRAGVVETAVRRKAFARAFKREVIVDTALPAQVRDLLSRDALQALSLVNKAGLALAGTFKVEGALKGGPVAALIHASDGSPDGVRKLGSLARATQRADLPLVQIFASRQLDLALGRTNVIHAALRGGGASEAFLERATRLQTYCEVDQPKGPPDGVPATASS